MQGKKNYAHQLFVSVNLIDLVPADNFYRRVGDAFDLHFLRKATEKYYGKGGQESIDPIVFFKIMLVGYLNNINSDRQLIAFFLAIVFKFDRFYIFQNCRYYMN
ncbi:transposase [Flavobacterium ardleyense]|uniref:Transposase n=1 Tax=Flavobacterium ardleyense TaxID=2038737 RepID=A0ABW5Z7Z8_9FLAO